MSASRLFVKRVLGLVFRIAWLSLPWSEVSPCFVIAFAKFPKSLSSHLRKLQCSSNDIHPSEYRIPEPTRRLTNKNYLSCGTATASRCPHLSP
ncbi:hypothetical protein DL96DRAFT_623688 [Flagelloscypha sp. PMI_526]|nr:hypothetical protein DL96DRAFT_623688 [Flagelloscypha sp. PMI_526]